MSDIVESLRWWAYKFCGKGAQEDDASDVMTNAIHEIEKLRAALLRAKKLFLQDEPQKAFIELCAALGEKE